MWVNAKSPGILIFAGALCLVGLSSGVRATDNPDLLDFDGSVSDPAGATPPGYVAMSARVYNYPAAAGPIMVRFRGVKFENPPGVNEGAVELRLYEANKVTRKADSVKVKQNSQVYVYLHVTTTATAFVASGLVPGCKGSVSVKDSPAGPPTEAVNWKFRCGDVPATLTALGLTAQQQAAYMTLFGNSIESKGKCRSCPTL